MKEVVYLEDLKQLEDPKNNVVDVAKATSLIYLGTVHPAGPIDGDISFVSVQFLGGANRTTGVETAIFEEANEDRGVPRV